MPQNLFSSRSTWRKHDGAYLIVSDRRGENLQQISDLTHAYFILKWFLNASSNKKISIVESIA